MTVDALWKKFLDRYPEFKNPDHVFSQTVRGFERSIRQAYEEGRKEGERKSTVKDSFRGIFG